MAKSEWDRYIEIYEKAQKTCRAWAIVELSTGKQVGKIIMRFTPNPYGRFGRGGMILDRRDSSNGREIVTERLVATAKAGGCGYDKPRHMIETMLDDARLSVPIAFE